PRRKRQYRRQTMRASYLASAAVAAFHLIFKPFGNGMTETIQVALPAAPGRGPQHLVRRTRTRCIGLHFKQAAGGIAYALLRSQTDLHAPHAALRFCNRWGGRDRRRRWHRRGWHR